MRKILLLLLWPLTVLAQTHPYSTNFPATENPISQGGIWNNGAAQGVSWGDVRTTPGLAFGTVVSGAPPFNDSTAVLKGTWTPNQAAQAIVHLTNGSDTDPQEEVELRLNTTITANNITGYEFDLSVKAGNPYLVIVRWNGPLNNFCYINTGSTCGSPNLVPVAVHDGDTIAATNVNGLLTLYINGVSQITATDTTYMNGSPGVGFWDEGGTTGDLAHFGFSSFQASDDTCSGMQWCGTLTPNRAFDWTTYAGIPGFSTSGTLPSDSWTQSGSTIAACGTSGSPVTPTACGIISALNTANGLSEYVKLGAGDFWLTAGMCLQGYNNVELRGSGANSTKLHFAANTACQGGNGSALIGFESADHTNPTPAPSNICNVTSGYTQGSTTINIASGCNQLIAAGTTAVVLDQCGTGYTGPTCTGSAVDNAGYFVCDDKYAATPTGCSENGPDTGLARPERFQAEWHLVTSCSPTCGTSGASTLTLTEPIVHPNYVSGQTPQIYLIQLDTHVGVRDLLVDSSAISPVAGASGVSFFNIAYPWVRNVAVLNIGSIGIYLTQTIHGDVTSNYIYNPDQGSTATDPSGLNHTGGFHLIANNICEQVRVCTIGNGPEMGSVIAYNYMINAFVGNNFMFGNLEDCHSDGCDFNLYEGNIAYQAVQDQVHGTHLTQTWNRNLFTGWESCSNGQCGTLPQSKTNTSAMDALSYNRYGNFISNVLGTTGITTTYQDLAGSSAFVNNTAWLIGSGNGGVSPAIPGDSIVGTTVMRWGNYDVVNNAVLECTAASTPIAACTANERGNGAPTYAALASPATTFPASFYYTSRPAWWSASIPFPAIGPDVTSGNVGKVAGTLNVAGHQSGTAAIVGTSYAGDTTTTAWAGHANAIPAMNCALATMGILPDGTGSAATFDPVACFSSVAVATPTASPVAGTYHGAQTITLSTTTGGATICYTVDGTTPTANGAGTCTHGTTYAGTFVVDLSLTVQAIGSLSGDTDSSVLSAAYVITHTTWYIRPDGGTKTQCTGLVNAAYPGSGSAQPCAVSHPYWMMNNVPGWTNFVGGDTMQFINTTGTSDTYFTGEQNAGVGIDWNANGLTVPCAPPNPGQANGASCVMPQVPSGTINAHTKMYGQSVGACHDSGHTHLVNPTILSGIAGAFSIINLRGASYVDVSCFGLTQPDTCTTVGNGTGKCGNLSNFVHFGGIVLNYLTGPGPSNITVTDVAAAGIGSQGILGSNMSGTNIFTDVYVNGNGGAGWSGDGGGCGTSCESTGVLNLSHNIYAWNGCVAVNYDFTMSYQLNSYNYCMAQQEGSFANGDGFVQIAAGAGFVLNVDHSDFSNNVQDGFDGLHLSDDLTTNPAINITTSIAAHNMGQNFKIGAGAASSAINNISIGDCRALTVDANYPLNPSGWSAGNQIPGDACRASGGNWVFALKAGTTLTLQNNTTVTYDTTTFNAGCISGTTCITGGTPAVGIFQNNSTYSLADPGNSGQFASGWFLPNGNLFNSAGGAKTFNNWYQNRLGCPDSVLGDTSSVCGNPGLASVTVSTDGTLVTVDPNITSSSLIYHAGTTIGGITTSYNGVARPPFSIGAFEPAINAVTTHTTIGTKHSIGTTKMQ